MDKPRHKAVAVVLAAVVVATASPSVAEAVPKDRTATSTCTGQVAKGTTEPYLFATPLFAGRGLIGTLIVPKNAKITVDAVADSWSGLYHNTPGSRDALRLTTHGLSYRSILTGEVRSLEGRTAWMGEWSVKQNGKWRKCTPGLPVVAFDPTA